MKIRFCPRCHTVFDYKEKEKRLYLVCPRCGYEEGVSETIVQEEYKTVEKVKVIGEDERKIRTMPTIRVECPKCGYKKAYWWTVQTRGGDEAATQFFRCIKCGHTWREYT